MQLKFDTWYGLFTRGSRGTRPVGALDNVENLVFNTKTLKPSLRTGYIKDLTAVPTEVSGQFVMASFRYPRGAQPATEVPTAQNITVLCGTDGSSGKHYLQRPYWGNNAGTINSSTWMKWGEYDVIDVTDIPPTTAANALDYQGAYGAGDNYFAGWMLCNFSRSEFLYVTGNTDTGGTAGNRSGTLTCLDDIPSDWTAADQYVLYRSFHDNPYDPTLNNTGFNPSWTDPIALKVGNNIIASGGQGSTVGYKPIWSGIVNATWFAGATRTPSMNATYVSELELKNTGTWLAPQAVGSGAGTLTTGKRYWIGLVWESFDGQRSTLFFPATTEFLLGDGTNKLTCSVRIDFHKMDKRCRYLHVFMAETETSVATAASIDYTSWFFVETHDLTSTGWTYNAAGAAPGYYSKTVDLDLPDWNNVDTATGDLETFLGHTKANRTIVSFSYGLVTAGRLFVSHYYDYNAALNYNDQVNFTPFAGNGVSQYAKLLDLDDQLQSSVESGDPSSIKGLAVWNSQLVVLKDTGSFSINITSDPTSWILDDISRKIGCDAPDSVVVTPQGVIWAKSGDGVYLWRNGEPIEISRNWRVASDDGSTNLGFRGLVTTASIVAQWQACYDAFYRSYKLVYTPDGSAFTTVYEAFLDVQDEKLGGLPLWTKHILAHNAKHLLVRSDNVIFFATGATASYQFSSTATQDGETTAGAGDGTAIRPYFHTGLYALTESDIATILDFTLSVYQAGSLEGSRQLDMIIYIDGSAQKTWANKTGSATRFNSRLPILGTNNLNRNGRTVAFEFNSQTNRRGLGTSYRIEELLINYEVKKRAFSQSL